MQCPPTRTRPSSYSLSFFCDLSNYRIQLDKINKLCKIKVNSNIANSLKSYIMKKLIILITVFISTSFFLSGQSIHVSDIEFVIEKNMLCQIISGESSGNAYRISAYSEMPIIASFTVSWWEKGPDSRYSTISDIPFKEKKHKEYILTMLPGTETYVDCIDPTGGVGNVVISNMKKEPLANHEGSVSINLDKNTVLSISSSSSLLSGSGGETVDVYLTTTGKLTIELTLLFARHVMNSNNDSPIKKDSLTREYQIPGSGRYKLITLGVIGGYSGVKVKDVKIK